MIRLTPLICIALFVFCTSSNLRASPVFRYEIDNDTDYIRIHHLENDLTAIATALQEKRVVIMDLRYVSSELDDALAFGGLVGRKARGIENGTETSVTFHPFEKSDRRPQSSVVLILVNKVTSGPVEAVLDALQSAGDALLVGTPTAGKTTWRTPGGPSIENTGAPPRLPVSPSPEEERAAYDALESGVAMQTLLDTVIEKPRFDEALLIREHNDTRDDTSIRAETRWLNATEKAQADENVQSAPYDRTLHRAINTVTAAKVLGRL